MKMSNTVRWVIAIVLILAGVIMAVFSLALLGFFTWECYGTSNSIAYTILYVASAVSLIGGIVPAVMLIRKTAGKFVAAAIVLGFIFSLAGIGAFMFYTLNIC
jgi:hypothetical protein